VSHAAGYLATQRAGPVEFQIGLIGSVATDPAFRGRGGAGEVLRATEERLAAGGAVVAALWSSDARFYESRGYAAAGSEARLTLPPGLDDPRRTHVRPLRASDLASVRALHAREASLTLRSPEDEARLFAVPGAEGFALDGDEGLAAYAVMGRGADFPLHVHEWGGEDAAVEALVRGIATKNRGRSITVLAPPFRPGVAERLALLGAAREDHALGLLKTLDRDALVDVANRAFGAAGAPHRARLDGPLVRVAPGPRGRAEVALDEAGWLRAILGGGRESGFEGLPLPFFVWGMDSI